MTTTPDPVPDPRLVDAPAPAEAPAESATLSPHAEVLACAMCGTIGRPGARRCRGCGGLLDATAAAELVHVGPVTAAARPPRWEWLRRQWDRTRLRWRWVAAGAVVLVVGGVLLGQWLVEETVGSPEPIVADYFAGLVAREGYTPPSNVEITGTTYGDPLDSTGRPNKSVAFVGVKYLLDGQPIETTVKLWREQGGALRGWTLADGDTGALQVVSPAHTPVVLAADVEVETVVSTVYDTMSDLPPGVYTVTMPPSPLLELAPVSVVVPSAIADTPVSAINRPHTSIELQAPSVRAEAVPVVQDAVREHLDECASITADLTPDGCPWNYSPFLDAKREIAEDSVTWRIVEYPKIDVRTADDPVITGGPAEVVTTAEGAVEISYRTPKGTAYTDTVTYDVGGPVAVDPAGNIAYGHQ